MTESPGPLRRRSVLALAGSVGVAGCLDSLTNESDDGDGPTDTPVDTWTPPGTGVGRDLEDWERYDPDWTAPTDSPVTEPLDWELVAENLEIPWDLAFAPTGELFITERTGTLLRFESGEVQTVTKPDEAIDAGALEPGENEEDSWWVEGGEGGTLGVAVHPDYPEVSRVYVYFTYVEPDGRYNKVVSYDVTADAPNDTAETVIERIPANSYHNGGRIAFGPRNFLWITTGDAGKKGIGPEKAQDTGSVAGKILRVTPDGAPAPGNPTLGDDADPRVFTYGHRNPQGINWLPDGRPVATEHGPAGHGELNLLEAGANYSWPAAFKRDQYEGTDYHRPLLNTGATSWAHSGCVFYTGDGVPQWRNRLLVGCLITQRIRVLTLTPPGRSLPPLDGESQRFDADWLDDTFTVTEHSTFVNELGRVRHVEQGPDGEVYAITSNRDGRASDAFPTERDDKLVRIVQG